MGGTPLSVDGGQVGQLLLTASIVRRWQEMIGKVSGEKLVVSHPPAHRSGALAAGSANKAPREEIGAIIIRAPNTTRRRHTRHAECRQWAKLQWQQAPRGAR